MAAPLPGNSPLSPVYTRRMSKHKINFQVLQAEDQPRPYQSGGLAFRSLSQDCCESLGAGAPAADLSDIALFDSDGEGSGDCIAWVSGVQ